jgi:hypothetical protein
MKTATDPFFGTNQEPLAAGRRGLAVTPSDTTDLPNVTSTLIVAIGVGGTGITVIFANSATDTETVLITLGPGTHQLNMQVRRVMATGTTLGTGGAVTALWSGCAVTIPAIGKIAGRNYLINGALTLLK